MTPTVIIERGRTLLVADAEPCDIVTGCALDDRRSDLCDECRRGYEPDADLTVRVGKQVARGVYECEVLTGDVSATTPVDLVRADDTESIDFQPVPLNLRGRHFGVEPRLPRSQRPIVGLDLDGVINLRRPRRPSAFERLAGMPDSASPEPVVGETVTVRASRDLWPHLSPFHRPWPGSRMGWDRETGSVVVEFDDDSPESFDATITVPLGVADWIRGLLASGISVGWASTYGRHARVFEQALGLPELPVLISIETHPPTSWQRHQGSGFWKMEALRSVAVGRPLIWADDQLPYEVRSTGNIPGRRGVSLVLPIDAHRGLDSKRRALADPWLEAALLPAGKERRRALRDAHEAVWESKSVTPPTYDPAELDF